MSLTNCLNDWCYRKSYYLKKPWRFFREIGQNIRASWQRATRGYAGRDVAEMDEFLLHIIPPMLRKLANSNTYPCDDEFPTYEAWQDWCNALADVFESVQEENWDKGQNEWESKWDKAQQVFHPHPNLTTTTTITREEAEEIRDKYWAREKELREKRDALILDAYTQLAKKHYYLWI